MHAIIGLNLRKMFLHLYCDEGKLLLLRWKADRYLLLPVILLYGIIILSYFYLLAAVIAGIIFIVWIGWIVFYHKKSRKMALFLICHTLINKIY